MSQPELLSTENLAPITPTRADLHEMACKTAEATFRDTGEIPPTWWIATGTRILMVATPWENLFEKRVSQKLVRMLLEVLDAQAYVFVSETWTAMVHKGDGPDAELAFKAKMAWIDEHGVLALPPDQREEILMVASSGRDKQNQHLSRYVINAGGKKKPWLGIRTDEDERGGTGPAFNLFAQPVDQRMMALAHSLLMTAREKH